MDKFRFPLCFTILCPVIFQVMVAGAGITRLAAAQEPEVFPLKRAGNAADDARKRSQPKKDAPGAKGRSSVRKGDARPPAFGLLDQLESVRPKRAEAQPVRKKDALDRVLDRLGGLQAWYAIGELKFERRISALDSRGQTVFEHEFRHETRTGFGPPKDWIEWSDSLSFGRQSGRPWARSGGIERSDLEERARAETARWSTLAHMPFCLRDRMLFTVEASTQVHLHGRKLTRVRVSKKAADLEAAVGPETRRAAMARERWDLYLDPNTELPILVEHFRPKVGKRRILLSQWQMVGGSGLRLPMQRTILGEDGESPRLSIRLRPVK